MSDYRYSNCPPQAFSQSHFSGSQQPNYNSPRNALPNESMVHQTQINHDPTRNNFSQQQHSNFRKEQNVNNLIGTSGRFFPQPNNVVVSNPFETFSTKDAPHLSQTPTYQAPTNRMPNFSRLPLPPQFNNFQQVATPYNNNSNKFHYESHMQYANQSNSSQMHVAPGDQHATCQNNFDSRQSSVSEKPVHNENHNSVNSSGQTNKVPFFLPENNQTNSQLQQNFKGLNLPHMEANVKPNFVAQNSGVVVRPHFPHLRDNIYRPMLPHANSSNFSNNPALLYRPTNFMHPFPVRGNLPPNVPLEQNVPLSNQKYPCNSVVLSQNLNGNTSSSPVPHFSPSPTPLPPSPFDLPHCSQNGLPIHIHSISAQVQTSLPYQNQPFVAPFQGSNLFSPDSNCRQDVLERTMTNFILKFEAKVCQEDKPSNKISPTVAEFHSALVLGSSLLNILHTSKFELTKSIHLEESSWNSKVNTTMVIKDKLSEFCNFITNNVHHVQEKLKKVKKKRDQKKKQKILQKLHRNKRLQGREELHQKIDRWLDLIKEKNLKLKRETEMKKEADDILSEVRKKIHEAKKTLEKLKVFEKLRNARKENSVQKGHFVLQSHDANFEEKVIALRNTMLKQLTDYEAEERALKVMLETEQEGQLEEEARWRLQRLQHLQRKKQKAILDALFGTSEEPSPSDSLFLFYQHYNSGNSSIENLVKIRHHWDMFLVPLDSEAATTVPQQWVTPEQPKNASWEIVKSE